MPFNYQVLSSWIFNLTQQTNLFSISNRVKCQPGYLFLYTVIENGRIAFDSTQSNISDYKMHSDNTVYKINPTSNMRFNILVLLEYVEKTFNSTTSAKAFPYPGVYQVKTWLQNVGMSLNSTLWSNGFDYDSNVIFITVTDGT